MSRILLSTLIAVFALATGGCSKRNDRLAGYSSAKGDLGDFIVKSAPKFGVRLLLTNELPSFAATWHYRATSDTLEVIIDGNCYTQLDAFLTKAIGPMLGQPTASRGSPEAYYGTNVGATVGCQWGIVESGKEYTTLVIVSYVQSASNQANYAALLHQAADAVKKGNDPYKALDVARSSAPYVSEFVRLFPEAGVRYRNFAGGLGFDVSVDLFERYELIMQLPAVFDSSHSKVIDYGEPRFTLMEAASVKRSKSGIAGTTLNPAGERRFGSVEWKKIVEGGGDFGTIGYAMFTNRPVQGFKDRKTAKQP